MPTTHEKPRHPLSGAPLPAPFRGPVIVTRYANGKIRASHKRDRETTYRCAVPYNNGADTDANHQTAAAWLLAKCFDDAPRMTLIALGHDADAYYHVAVGTWQLSETTDADA